MPEQKYTSLFQACSNGDAAIRQFLAEYPEVDPNAPNGLGEVALVICTRWEDEKKVQALLDDPKTNADAFDRFAGGKIAALHTAVYSGFIPGIELLIAKGANIEIRSGANQTPLCIAVSGATSARPAESTRLLLEKGANPNITFDDEDTKLAKMTPLHLAALYATHGDFSTLALLVQYGADVTARAISLEDNTKSYTARELYEDVCSAIVHVDVPSKMKAFDQVIAENLLSPSKSPVVRHQQNGFHSLSHEGISKA